ncbi:MAG: protein kinase [Polyangiaceae bacterium]|nr:protein kinase [Polyangiaceae bacterium]
MVHSNLRMDFQGKLLAERYRLESLLAEGGMGQVWIARHLSLDIQVAVKIMLATALSNSALRTRFEREAKACAQLRSPHVVQVFDYGVHEDLPFLVMELLDGEDLTSLCSKQTSFTLEEAANLVSQAAKGLSAAHACGIVHRDVKPSNLFMARLGTDRVLKVLDFGIAKIFDDGPKMTRTNVVLGSPSYMSPEQLLGGEVDVRTDVWALGVVAFLLVTGELPFRGPTPLDVGYKIRIGDRPKPSSIVPSLGEPMDALFERALALNAEKRHASVVELAEDFSRIAKSAPAAMARPRAQTLPTRVGGENAKPGVPTNVGPTPAESQPAALAPAPLVRKQAMTERMAPSQAPWAPISSAGSMRPSSPADATPSRSSSTQARARFASTAPLDPASPVVSPATLPFAHTPSLSNSPSETLRNSAMAAPAKAARDAARGATIRTGALVVLSIASVAALALSLTLWMGRGPASASTASKANAAEPPASPTSTSPEVTPVSSETVAPASTTDAVAASSASSSPSSTPSASATAAPSQQPASARAPNRTPSYVPPQPYGTPVAPAPAAQPAPTTPAKRPIGLGL